MGMGMMLWEWEGAGTLKLIPAHLYPTPFPVCSESNALSNIGLVIRGNVLLAT